MGFRKQIESITGAVCEWHALHTFDIDPANRTCTAYFGAYRSAEEAHARINPVETYPIRCDGAEPGDGLIRTLYGMASLDSRFVGASAFSDDAAYGIANPASPLPEKGVAPSRWHEWDVAAWEWAISAGALESAKTDAKTRINLSRDEAERGGFEAYGKVFDSDDKSINRILSAAQAASAAKAASLPMSVEWTCADNSTITLDADMLLALPLHMAMAGNAIHAKAKALKASIDAASSIPEIEAIVW